jgi:hypothetical protein
MFQDVEAGLELETAVAVSVQSFDLIARTLAPVVPGFTRP